MLLINSTVVLDSPHFRFFVLCLLCCISVELRGFFGFKPLGGVNFLTLGAWWWLALGWLVLDGFGLRAGIAFAAARQLSWQIIVL